MHMKDSDTIFALASGAAPSAIAIVRISGPHAFAAVASLTTGALPPAQRPSVARLCDPADGTMLDEALLLLFARPASATGEDVAELHLHGGRAVVRAVLRVLGERPGLRAAQAGEFTRRAFLNGRIDLNQAEGLSDLLAAETEHQRRVATHMMDGAFGRAIEAWRSELLTLSALTEAELDLSDEDDVGRQDNINISISCVNLAAQIDQLLARPSAEKLRDGLRVVLAGPPNSGKSTLLNALAARDAAIVSDIAGTTRDIIEVPLLLDGIPLILVDTAGLREAGGDAIEKIGIARAHQAFVSADIILWLGPESMGPDHPHLIEIAAKSDQAQAPQKSDRALPVSGLTGDGLTLLWREIVSRAQKLLPPPDGFAVNARQRELLMRASTALQEAVHDPDWLIIAEQLRLARLALDALTGRTHTEDLLDRLFSTFCVGK